MHDYAYPGSELAIFAKAMRWKSYFRETILPYLGPLILEVGAGIGANTKVFAQDKFERWVCLEPDLRLYEQLSASLPSTSRHEAVPGTLAALDPARKFHTILYLDVLEHIQDDRAELRLAAGHLQSGGALVVLAPAHGWLYTPFDRAIGHYRRYSKVTLAPIAPPWLRLEKLWYLDSVGLLALLGNRLLLKRSLPTEAQILFWDRWLVRCSHRLDPLLAHSVGKSVLGIWRAP